MNEGALLQVDIGGSSWRAALVGDGATWTGTCFEPPPISNGELSPDRLQRGLCAIRVQMKSAGVTDPTVVAMASTGVARLPGSLDAMHIALRDWESVTETLIVSDAAAGLAGALGTLSHGSLLSVGTGVAAISRTPDGAWSFCDGWGPLLGDEGGGYWVGSRGLRAALRHHDGRSEGPRRLLEAATALFGPPADGWPLRGDLETTVNRVAGFAATVVEAASQGDEAASTIVRRAAERLIETALPLAQPATFVSGGMLESEVFRTTLLDLAEKREITLSPTTTTPLSGLGLIRTYGTQAFAAWCGDLGTWRAHS